MRKIQLSLPLQIVLGLLLGITCGLFFGEIVAPLGKIGQAFIMLLKMSILPYMSFSLIHAIGSLTPAQGKRVAYSGFFALLLIWALSLTVVYLVSYLFPAGETTMYHSELAAKGGERPEMLQLFIPINPIHALANDIVPAVVFFSLVFGVALMHLESKKVLLANLEVGCSALTLITQWVTRLSPIGVFALIADAVGRTPFHQIEKIQLYAIAFIAGICILCLLLIPLLIGAVTPVSSRVFMRHMRPAVLLAFTTGNTLVSLPYVVSGLEALVKETRLANEGENRGAVGTMVPLAYNFPTIGNVFSILFLLFMGFFYGQSFSFVDHLRLVGTGMMVLFGAGASVIAGVGFLIDSLRLPIDGIGLFLETMPLTRHFQTMGSTLGIGATTLLTVVIMEKRFRVSLRALALSVGVSLSVLVMMVVAVNSLHLGSSGPKEVFSGLTLHSSVVTKLFREGDPLPELQKEEGESLLDQIKRLRVLRVGYREDLPPFSYLNKHGQLVGYDVALAHHLATALNADIYFIPMRYDTLEKDLSSHRIDIAMASVSVTEERLRHMRFSDPYMTMERVFLTYDHRRREFADLKLLQEKSALSIAALDGSVFVDVARKTLPEAKVIHLNSYKDFLKPGVADALLWSEAEATTWSLMYPLYTAVIPAPSLGKEIYAFALPTGEDEWTDFVNYWLDIKRLDGFVEEQHKRWILGETSHSEPRWSIIRDVLHWVD